MLNQRLSGANPRLVVSLQEVPYMDSLALDGLVKAADEMIASAIANIEPTWWENRARADPEEAG